MLGLLLSLGFWQLDRAAQKRDLQAAYAEASAAAPRVVASIAEIEALPRYTRVTLRGAYDGSRQALLDVQVYRSRAGYRVWTPFVLDNGGTVLVDRGWVPADPDRRRLPELDVAGGAGVVVGMVAPLPQAGIDLGSSAVGDEGWPQLLLWPDADELAAYWGAGVPARIVLLDAAAPDGFVRDWAPAAGMPPERHLGYAVQWFGLALALVVIWVVVTRRKRGKVDGEG